jgi:hypothetical protein
MKGDFKAQELSLLVTSCMVDGRTRSLREYPSLGNGPAMAPGLIWEMKGMSSEERLRGLTCFSFKIRRVRIVLLIACKSSSMNLYLM